MANWGERKNFGNSVAEIQQKWGERKRKRGREKAEEFRQHCYQNSSAQNAARSVKKRAIAAMPLLKKEKKKNCFGNCGNAIAENGKKNYEICEWVKKKLSRTQYFYNIFIINHTWLIIISSKNLWQINCGNGIAENVKKKKKFGNCGNPIADNVKKKKLFWQLWQSHC